MRLIYPILFLLLLGCASPSTPSSNVEQAQGAEDSKVYKRLGIGALAETTETTRTGGQDDGTNRHREGNEETAINGDTRCVRRLGYFGLTHPILSVIDRSCYRDRRY